MCLLCRRSGREQFGRAGFSFDNLHASLDECARDQRGPVGNHLSYRRAAIAKPSTSGRTAQNQRHQFTRETVNSLSILTAHANAHLHLGWIRIRNRYRTVTCIYAKEFGVDLIEGQAELSETLAHDAVGCLRFFERLWSAVN